MRKMCKSREKEKFPEIGGNELKQGNGEEFEICGERLKKGRQKFWRMKIENFLGKRSKWGNFPRSPTNLSEIGGI